MQATLLLYIVIISLHSLTERKKKTVFNRSWKKTLNLLENTKPIFITTGATFLPTQYRFQWSMHNSSHFSGRQAIYLELKVIWKCQNAKITKVVEIRARLIWSSPQKRLSKRTAVYFTPDWLAVLVKYLLKGEKQR